jgi:methyltransferase family protein
VTVAQPLVERILTDPPLVHGIYDATGAVTGHHVHSTDLDCYRLIADACSEGVRTLETGLGVSTALFAALGTDHTCVTYAQDEVDRLLDWSRRCGVDARRVTFHVGDSAAILPSLAPDPLDLVFIDGGHGFPLPVLDWYHGAGRLRDGGVLVVDDVPLPAVSVLTQFLDLDPRWAPLARTGKWAAYRRTGGGTLAQDWWQQPFLRGPALLNADARRCAAAAVARVRTGLPARVRARVRAATAGRARPSAAPPPAPR